MRWVGRRGTVLGWGMGVSIMDTMKVLEGVSPRVVEGWPEGWRFLTGNEKCGCYTLSYFGWKYGVSLIFGLY